MYGFTILLFLTDGKFRKHSLNTQALLISHLISDTRAQSYHKQKNTAWGIQTMFFARQLGNYDGLRTKLNWLLFWFASLVPQVNFFCFELNAYLWWNVSMKKGSCGRSTFAFNKSFMWKPSDNPTVLLSDFLWSFNILFCNVNLWLHSCRFSFPTYWKFNIRNCDFYVREGV